MTKAMERQRMLDSIFSGKTGLGEWCDRCRTTQAAIRILRDEDDSEMKKAAEIYSQKKLDEMRQEKDSELKVFVDAVKARVRNDLEETLKAKEAAFHNACGAPSDENVRLLSVLKMRDSVSSEEIAEAAGHLAGNLVALGVLGEIARSNNVYFPVIHTDYRTVCNDARKAAERIINCIGEDTTKTDDSPIGKVKYAEYLFYHENGGNSYLSDFVEKIDKPGYLNIADIKPSDQGKNNMDDGGTDAAS